MNIIKSYMINLLTFIPDKLYLKLKYSYKFKKRLHLMHPQTFNEKIQWLKLYDRKAIYTSLVDKYNVRHYIEKKIGGQYLIPLIGVYERVEDIPWEALPNQFVLKCTHGSQCNIICKDKNSLDINDSKKKLKKWMDRNWFWYGREWPYKNVKPRIVAEQYMVDESEVELKDYKIFCFNGEPKVIQVDFDRFNYHRRNLYDIDWNYIEGSIKYPTDPDTIINKPRKLNEMLDIARALSYDFYHVRVDLYSIKDEIYFGELTFHHGSGFENFSPYSLGLKFGNWLNLS